MSWSVNGVTWIPQTASAHAQSQLTYLNSLQAASGGPQLIASPTNALWLNFLGSGSIQQTYDTKLYAASQSFNISTCDDQQVLNLAPITGTGPNPATYSTVYLNVTAAAGGAATVPINTLAPWNGINFKVSATTNIPAGTTVSILCIADTPGPYLALAGQITSFSAPILNVQTVINPANSTQGSDTESIASFRQRLIMGNGTVNWDLDGTIQAIRALQGIISANVFFNPDTVATMTLPGGINIPPRHAKILIQGSDVTGMIPDTYANRMTAPTDGSLSGNFVSLSGQVIPIKWDEATAQNVYVTIYVDPTQPKTGGYATLIQNVVLGLNSQLTIGQAVNTQFILEAFNNFQEATISGASVSLDGVTYSRSAAVNGNRYGQFIVTNILVVDGP